MNTKTLFGDHNFARSLHFCLPVIAAGGNKGGGWGQGCVGRGEERDCYCFHKIAQRRQVYFTFAYVFNMCTW